METQEVTDSVTQGYCVKLYVNADGTFNVEGPVPHEPEAPASEYESETMPGEPSMMEGEAAPVVGEGPAMSGEPLPNIGQALKAVLKIVQDNPIGESAQAGFEAGYASGPNRA